MLFIVLHVPTPREFTPPWGADFCQASSLLCCAAPWTPSNVCERSQMGLGSSQIQGFMSQPHHPVLEGPSLHVALLDNQHIQQERIDKTPHIVLETGRDSAKPWSLLGDSPSVTPGGCGQAGKTCPCSLQLQREGWVESLWGGSNL